MSREALKRAFLAGYAAQESIFPVMAFDEWYAKEIEAVTLAPTVEKNAELLSDSASQRIQLSPSQIKDAEINQRLGYPLYQQGAELDPAKLQEQASTWLKDWPDDPELWGDK